MRRASAIIAAAAVMVAGCGVSAEDRAASTVHGYLDAFVDGDGAKACSLMASTTRADFVARIQRDMKTSDCGVAIDRIHNRTGPRVLRALKDAKISHVKIQGDSATARNTSGSSTTVTALLKEHGSWRIAVTPGGGQ